MALLNLNPKVENLIQNFGSDWGDNDRKFARRIFEDGLVKYEQRLKQINFVGKSPILDAGCGFGQWTIPLSLLNESVTACDVSSSRVEFAKELSLSLGVGNVDFKVHSLEQLPYEDSYFEAIFCYGVIFLTPWREVLREFKRVLKTHGRLYLSANAFGWYHFLWSEEHNRAQNYDPKAIAAASFIDTLEYNRNSVYRPGMNLIIEPDEMVSELEKLHFSNITVGADGQLFVEKKVPTSNSFFAGEYKGQTSVFEILATHC